MGVNKGPTLRGMRANLEPGLRKADALVGVILKGSPPFRPRARGAAYNKAARGGACLWLVLDRRRRMG
jgi:hypothetical protein